MRSVLTAALLGLVIASGPVFAGRMKYRTYQRTTTVYQTAPVVAVPVVSAPVSSSVKTTVKTSAKQGYYLCPVCGKWHKAD